MRRAATAFAIAAALSPPAAAGIFDYSWPDAKLISDDGHAFTVYLQPKRDVILLEPRLIQAYTGPPTAWGAPSKWPINVWRHAAELFVQPIGCGLSDVHAVWKTGAAWEADVVCPADVDLHKLVSAQRHELLAGQPLHP